MMGLLLINTTATVWQGNKMSVLEGLPALQPQETKGVIAALFGDHVFYLP